MDITKYFKRAIFSILISLIFKAAKHRFVFWSLNVGSANNKGSTVFTTGEKETLSYIVGDAVNDPQALKCTIRVSFRGGGAFPPLESYVPPWIFTSHAHTTWHPP